MVPPLPKEYLINPPLQGFPIRRIKKANFSVGSIVLIGRNDGIRTHDLLVPNQTHYQAVLRPDSD